MMKFLEAIGWINELTGRAVSYLVVIIVGVILYEVSARYLFDSPTIWAHETSQIIYGAYVILLGGYVMKQGGHVNVEVLYHRFRPRTRAWIDIFTWPLFFCFCGVLLIKGWGIGWESLNIRETAPTTFGPPVYITKLLLPLGALLMLIQGLSKYIKTICLLLEKKEEGT